MATYFNNFDSIDTSNSIPHKRENINSIYENRGMIGLETYFGRTPIVLDTIEAFNKIQELLPSKGKIDSENAKNIKLILDDLGKLMATEFNVDSVTIGLDSNDNACAYPLVLGKRKDRKNATKIEETATGYRFTNNENIKFIIVIGIPRFLGDLVTGEHVAAECFHEIGHQFQLCEDMGGVRFNISIMHLRTITDHFVSLLHGIMTSLDPHLILNLFMVVVNFLRLDKLFGRMNTSINRTLLAKEIDNGTTETLKRSIKRKEKNITESVHSYIHQLLITIPIIGPVYGLTIGGERFLKGVIGFPYTALRKKHEKFADQFAIKYGLGTSLSETFVQELSSTDNGTKSLAIVNKIPGIRALVQLNSLFVYTCTTASVGYPSDRKRILLTYKNILKEINDPNIPPDLKASAIEELKQVKEVYDMYINTKTQKEHQQYARAFVYSISRFFLRIKLPTVVKDSKDNPDNLSKVVTKDNATVIKEKPNFMFIKLFNSVRESFSDTFGKRSTSTESLDIFNEVECSIEEISICKDIPQTSKSSRFPIFEI